MGIITRVLHSHMAGHDSRRRATSCRCRPHMEVLERRYLLTGDPLLFIEDFSLDSNPARAGFDGWDLDPATAADRIWIQHTIVARQSDLVRNEVFIPGSTFEPSRPFAFGMLGPARDTIHLPPPGADGGLAAGEEITAVAIAYNGLGTITFLGDNGTKTVQVSTAGLWDSVTVTANSPSDSGQEVGRIRQVVVDTIEAIYIDDIALLVGGIISNNPPVANPDILAVLPGSPLPLDLLANDTDGDGDAITLTRVTSPQHGQLLFVNNVLTYTPDVGFHGVDQFEYFITDHRMEQGTEVSGRVSITSNTPPPAPIIEVEVPHGYTGPFTFNESVLLANVIDLDGDELTIEGIEPPLLGTLTRSTDGMLTYTPAPPDALVPDEVQFQFRLRDPFTAGDLGVAFLDPNETPQANSEVYHVDHGTPGPFRGVLRISDPDGDLLTMSLINLEINPATGRYIMSHGELLLNNDRPLANLSGEIPFAYYPQTGDLRGNDRFTYRVTDLYGTSATATIEIRVPNFPPVIVFPEGQDTIVLATIWPVMPSGNTDHRGRLYEWAEGGDGVSKLERCHECIAGPPWQLIYAADLNNDTMWAVLDQSPVYGNVTINERGDFVYTPNSDSELFGTDVFSFRVSDGVSLSNDTIYVEVRQSYGKGIARSDIYQSEDYEIDDIDPPEPDPIIIDWHYLLANDRTDTHWAATHVVRGLKFSPGDEKLRRVDAHLNTIGPPIDEANPFVGINETVIIKPRKSVSDGRSSIRTFEYQFLYSPPGLLDSVSYSEMSASEPATVVIVYQDEFQGDSDGVYDEVEDSFGDGNDDGVLDSAQPHVATIPVEPSTPSDVPRGVTLVAERGASLFGVSSLQQGEIRASPPGEYPLGLIQFSVTGLSEREATQITLIPLTSLPGIYINRYYKYGKDSTDNPATPDINESFDRHWYPFDFDGETGAIIYYTQNGVEVPLTPNTPQDVYEDNDVRITRIVLHLIDDERGDEEFTNGIITDPGAPVFIGAAPPRVPQVRINDGQPQRSMVNSLTVTFDEIVSIQQGAFELRKRGVNQPIRLNIEVTQNGEQTLAHLTFHGAGVVRGSLRDGRYQLRIHGEKIRGSDGSPADFDDDGVEGGQYVHEFFRRFGDADGDGDIDRDDRETLNTALGSKSGDAGYLWYLDGNANGRLGTEDVDRFWAAYCRDQKLRRRSPGGSSRP